MNKTSILNETKEETSREKTIIKTSIIGIIANVFLAGFKAAIGLLSNSIQRWIKPPVSLLPVERREARPTLPGPSTSHTTK